MIEQQNEAPTELKPGETISPGAVATSPAPALAPQPVPQTPEVPPAAPVVATDAFPGNQATPLELAPAPEVFAPQTEEPLISWTASEFITHEKSTDWYLALAVIDIVVAVLVYLIFRDLVTTAVVVAAGIGFAVYGGWKPRQQEYNLTGQGVAIGQRFFGFEEFRSFSIVDEGAFTSIQFWPLKRFGAPVNMYYDPNDEPAIMELIGSRLPLEEAKHDPVDKLMRRIRF